VQKNINIIALADSKVDCFRRYCDRLHVRDGRFG